MLACPTACNDCRAKRVPAPVGAGRRGYGGLRARPPCASLAGVSELAQIVARLRLQPLPREGGWYAPVWRSGVRLTGAALPERYGAGAERVAASSILYLMAGNDFSALHRLRSDEVWQFHAGDAVELLRLGPEPGSGSWTRLGPAVAVGELPQAAVPHGAWQGARLVPGGKWALVGCTMAPGWDEADFELGRRAELAAAWPEFAGAIAALTRE